MRTQSSGTAAAASQEPSTSCKKSESASVAKGMHLVVEKIVIELAEFLCAQHHHKGIRPPIRFLIELLPLRARPSPCFFALRT